jgi:hypothetical protein
MLPRLEELRPLIVSEAVLLVSARRVLYEDREAVASLASHLLDRLGRDPPGVTRRFRPADLAVADNAKALFTFAGGERDAQIRHALCEAIDYFAGEYSRHDRTGRGARYGQGCRTRLDAEDQRPDLYERHPTVDSRSERCVTYSPAACGGHPDRGRPAFRRDGDANGLETLPIALLVGAEHANLAVALAQAGLTVFEVNRPDRARRRRNGKSDPADAQAADPTVRRAQQ